jgi:hypothetical protein
MLERRTIAGRQMIMVKGKWTSAEKYRQLQGSSRRYKAVRAQEAAETRVRVAEEREETAKSVAEWFWLLPALVVMAILVVTDKGGPAIGTDPWSLTKFRCRG